MIEFKQMLWWDSVIGMNHFFQGKPIRMCQVSCLRLVIMAPGFLWPSQPFS